MGLHTVVIVELLCRWTVGRVDESDGGGRYGVLLEEYMMEVGPLGGDVNLELGRDECSALCVSVHEPGSGWCGWNKKDEEFELSKW